MFSWSQEDETHTKRPLKLIKVRIVLCEEKQDSTKVPPSEVLNATINCDE